MKVTLIKGEKYLLHEGKVLATFHSIFKPSTIFKHMDSSLIEYRFVNANLNHLVNSASAITIKNYKEGYIKVPLMLFNPENGHNQQLTTMPVSLRNLKVDKKNECIQLQKYAFNHSLIGCHDMLTYQSKSLFKYYLGPRLPGDLPRLQKPRLYIKSPLIGENR
jgi:hypothetical protein